MNILLLNWKDIHNPRAGGAEILIWQLARRLTRDGHTVTLFTRAFPGSPTAETIDGIRLIRQGGLWSVYGRAWLYYQRLKVKPDLVIDMVNTLPWFTPWYVPSSKRFLFVNQLAGEVFFYHLPPPLSWFAYWTERFLYSPYKHTPVIAISKSTRDDLVSYGLPPAQIHIASPGIDHRRYYPGEHKEQFPLFVFVGRLVKMKRADVCIDAMAIVVARHPKAQLIIIGQGPEKQALLSRIQRLYLEKNVQFLSNNQATALNNDQSKVQLLQRAWALLLPSVKEGWGMVVTEAAACRTPAIVSNVSGLRDSVINRKTGLIGSPLPTPQELARMMLEIIEQPSLREELSRGALAWSKKFDWEKSYQRFKEVLQKIS